MTTTCRVCLSENTDTFLELGQQPNTMHLLQEGQKDSLLELTMSICLDCGFIYIESPGQREEFYDYVQLPTSMFPAEHIGEEIEELTGHYLDSADDMILEIACNDGYFLNELRRAGYANSYGIEPSKPAAKEALQLGLTVYNEYFCKELAERFVREHGHPKLVISRHVLEHVEDLDSFTKGLAILMSDETTLFLEVPDMQPVEERADFSSIWEQHVNYFDVESLRLLFARFGIEVLHHRTVPFTGGSLITVSRRNQNIKEMAVLRGGRIERRMMLGKRMRENMDAVKKLLGDLRAQGKRIAGYGCGARCSGFINFSDSAQYLDYIVDDDPRKYGLRMPKSGLGIYPSGHLLEEPVDYCIVLPFNSKINEAKVMENNKAFIDAGGRFIGTWVAQKNGEVSAIKIV